MRSCFNCNSNTTYVDKKGWHQWYRSKNGYSCKKCRNVLIGNPKRLRFRGKRISLSKNPRKGRCSNQKCVKEESTDIHHIKYHPEDPLKDTIELCNSCHMKESWKNGSKLGRPKKVGGK